MLQSLFAWRPSAVWAAVLFLLSAWSNAPEPSWFPASDKVVHLCLYTVLGAALAWGGRRTWTSPRHVLLVLVGILYGASDEWHQSFVPGRDSSPWDWAADNVGVLLGYVVLLLIAGRIATFSGGDRSRPRRTGTRSDS